MPGFYPLDNTGGAVFMSPFWSFLMIAVEKIAGKPAAQRTAPVKFAEICGPGEGLYPYPPLNVLFQNAV
jgi:hypothetical protein